MSLHFKKLNKKESARIALDNHLYVDGWMMHGHYEIILNGDFDKINKDILVMFRGEIPIGCALIGTSRQVSIYITPKYRKKGYASKLINFILRKNGMKKNEVFAGFGSSDSPSFFRKNKVMMLPYSCIPVSSENNAMFVVGKISMKNMIHKQVQELYSEYFNAPTDIVFQHKKFENKSGFNSELVDVVQRSITKLFDEKRTIASNTTVE